MVQTTNRPKFAFIGGHPVLDFVNTLDGRLGEQQFDLLDSYDSLRDWISRAGLVAPVTADSLAAMQTANPKKAAAVVVRAVTLRDSLYHLLSSLAAGKRATPRLLEMLNAEYGRARVPLTVVPGGQASGMRWAWSGDLDLFSPLREIVLSAGLFLTSKTLDRLRKCSVPKCSALYLDATRNRSRRWCDSATCGNRERVRRHYYATRPRRRRATR